MKNKFKLIAHENLITDRKIDCGKTKGYPFCLVFAHRKNGKVVLTGSLNKIHEHCKDWDPCHGFVVFYTKEGAAGGDITMLGENHHFSIDHLRKTSRIRKERWSKDPLMKHYICDKNCYRIYYKNGNNKIIVKDIRRIPNKYIKEFDYVYEEE